MCVFVCIYVNSFGTSWFRKITTTTTIPPVSASLAAGQVQCQPTGSLKRSSTRLDVHRNADAATQTNLANFEL